MLKRYLDFAAIRTILVCFNLISCATGDTCYSYIVLMLEIIEILYFFSSFGGKSSDSLAGLRHKKYVEMVSTANMIHPENLPPTERASIFHAFRVHLQVITICKKYLVFKAHALQYF